MIILKFLAKFKANWYFYSQELQSPRFYLDFKLTGQPSIAAQVLPEDTRLPHQRQRSSSLAVQHLTQASCSGWFSLIPKSQRGDTEGGPGECCTHRGFRSQLRNPKFRKSQSFNNLLNVLQANLPTLAPEGDFIFSILDSKLLQRKIPPYNIYLLFPFYISLW